MTFVVIVELEVYPGHLDEFLAGIRANSRASRNEKGCIRFDVHRDVQNPCRFYFYEMYTDEDAFKSKHRGASHYDDWQKIVARCVVPGTQHNTYAQPLFPQDIPELSTLDRSRAPLQTTAGK